MKSGWVQRAGWAGVALTAVGLQATMAVAAETALMQVSPDVGFVWASAGEPGGPFQPTQVTYTVANQGTVESLSWSVTQQKGQAWVTLSQAGGVLAPGHSTALVVVLSSAAASALSADGYSEQLIFTNLTNNTFVKPNGSRVTGPTSRYVTLNVLRTGEGLYQGFGATTRGGAGGPVFHVTTLGDNGDQLHPLPGSLRDAVSQSNRYIVFDVAGTIPLQTHLWVLGDHLTIDGFAAPPPGITIKNYGVILRGNRGAHDVVVRGLRFRQMVPGTSQWDWVQVAWGAFNIVIDHLSTKGANDGNIDITESAHDVTVSWSILAQPATNKNMLIKYRPSRISLHHNLFVKSGSRNPQIAFDDLLIPAGSTTTDMQNNLVWVFSSYGTLVWKGAWANVLNNYYSKASKAIRVERNGRAYVRGNVVHRSTKNINKVGREPAPFPAPPITTTDAKTAACQILNGAGVRPADAVDRGYLARIKLSGCKTGGIPPSVAITTPASESTVSGMVVVAASAMGGLAIAGVQLFLDGLALGPEQPTPPYFVTWDTTTVPDGPHTLHARARDVAGNLAFSPGVTVAVDNTP